MAYTEKQWNKFQASLPEEERTSYLDYLKETDPAEYSRVVSSILENLKKAELQSNNSITKVLDEGTKLSGARTDTAAQKAAAVNAANALARLKAAEAGSKGTGTPAPSPTPEPTKKTLSNAELQAIVAKLAKGQQLTDEEAAAINAPTPTPTTTGGTPTPTPTVTKRTFTSAELQSIVAKLGRGEPLTAEEAEAIGSIVIPTPTTTGGTPTPTPTLTSNLIPTPTPTTTGNTPTPTPTLTGNTPTPTPTGGTPTPTPTLTGATPTPSITGTTPIPTGTTPTPTGTTTKAQGPLTYTATDGTVFTDQAAFTAYQKILTDAAMAKKATDAASTAERQSAYDLLYAQFSAYGLGSLVEPLRGLIQSGSSPAEFTIKLRESEPYKKRFSANAQRISKGLKAIGEAEYLGLEDQYQNILRNAGLPESYWKRGDLGVQEGFTNFIANDVSAVELEDRVNTAQQRVLYANPEVSIALKTFYPDISNGDLLAYALDPTKGLDQIKRRITAAEIGSSAVQMGLATNVTDAEYLARYGVNKAQAQQGYGTIAGGLERGSQLASMYGENPYTQTTAEQEVFAVPGAAEARKQRQKITGLEKATFGGQTGLSQGALARDRAGNF